jgi:hypothetical protein
VSQKELLILLPSWQRVTGVALDISVALGAQGQVDLEQPEYLLNGRLGLT